MNYGKSIRLFLIEGIADVRWMCELSNWTGKAYKIPRNCVKESSDREELKNTGIYFLFGKSDETDTYRVYIGEAENIYERLLTHLKIIFLVVLLPLQVLFLVIVQMAKQPGVIHKE